MSHQIQRTNYMMYITGSWLWLHHVNLHCCCSVFPFSYCIAATWSQRLLNLIMRTKILCNQEKKVINEQGLVLCDPFQEFLFCADSYHESYELEQILLRFRPFCLHLWKWLQKETSKTPWITKVTLTLCGSLLSWHMAFLFCRNGQTVSSGLGANHWGKISNASCEEKWNTPPCPQW